MTGPTTAREALIAEALGDVASLLDRVDSLTTSMEVGCLALANASVQLDDKLKAFETGTTRLTRHVQARAVEHILKRTGQATSESIEAQAHAMNVAARLAFAAQGDSTLARLTNSLQNVLQRVDRPWELWLTHAATAAVSAAITWWVVSAASCR